MSENEDTWGGGRRQREVVSTASSDFPGLSGRGDQYRACQCERDVSKLTQDFHNVIFLYYLLFCVVAGLRCANQLSLLSKGFLTKGYREINSAGSELRNPFTEANEENEEAKSVAKRRRATLAGAVQNLVANRVLHRGAHYRPTLSSR